jgi:hypothetical protein
VTDSITYYDRSTLTYMSVFLRGFRAFAPRNDFKICVDKSVPSFLREPEYAVSEEFIRRVGFKDAADVVLNCAGLFKAQISGREFFFCIDAGDNADPVITVDGVYLGYHVPLLEKVKYYFKVNYNKESLSSNPRLRELCSKVVPVPIVYPTAVPRSWEFLPAHFPCNILARDKGFGMRRVKDIINLAATGDLSRYRNRRKAIDAFFVVNYYENPVHESDNEFRFELIQRLRSSKRLATITGFASRQPLPGKFEKLRVERYSMTRYFKALAESRIGIYCRGVHNCLSFKLGALLEMGLPIVGQRLMNNEDFYYQLPYMEEQFAFDTPSAITERLELMINSPKTLQRWAISNGSIFDRSLSPEAIVGSMLEAMRGEGDPSRQVGDRCRDAIRQNS